MNGFLKSRVGLLALLSLVFISSVFGQSTQVTAHQLYEEAVILQNQATAKSRKEAINKYEESLILWQQLGNKAKEAEILNELGTLYDLLGITNKVLDFYTRSLEIWRVLGNKRHEAILLNNIGFVYSRQRNYQLAFDYYSKSIELRRLVGDKDGEAITINNIGIVYSLKGEPDKALEYYTKSLEIWQSISLETKGKGSFTRFQKAAQVLQQVVGESGEAQGFKNIAGINERLGKYKEALDYYNRSLLIRKKLGDLPGQASIFNNLGLFYASHGDIEKGIELLTEALRIREKEGNRDETGRVLNNLGLCYRYGGELEIATSYFEKALNIRTELGQDGESVITLLNLASVYEAKRDYDKALEILHKGLERNRDKEGPSGAGLLNRIGVIYGKIGKYEKSIELLKEALALRQKQSEKQAEAAVLHNLGDTYHGLKEFEKAETYYNQSLALRIRLTDRIGQAATFHSLAQLYRERSNLIKALHNSEKAVEIVEGMRASLMNLELRSSFLASVHRYYDFYIQLLVELHENNATFGYDSLALEVSEKAHARTLLDLLEESFIDIKNSDTKSLEAKKRLELEISSKSESFLKLIARGRDTEAEKLDKEIKELTNRLEEVKNEIKKKNPLYADIVLPKILKAEEIQELLDDKTVILEYFIGEKTCFLWLISREYIKVYKLASKEELLSASKSFYELLKKPSSSAKMEIAAELGRLLLKPIEQIIDGKKLIIIRDDILHYIPFSALIVGGTELIRKHEITYHLSASVLASIRRQAKEKITASKGVVLVADPVFDTSDLRLKVNKNREGSLKDVVRSSNKEVIRDSLERVFSNKDSFLPRLPFSRIEAETIAGMLLPNEYKYFLGFNANKRNILCSNLYQFRV
ncbi:MAG: tetratricopeptide repeat protein, partial [Blastocatellia bacterium]|nr:tetratricopeptide repeat protein [Blastocatellia bacterium]